jgi:hypothetical protein
MKKILTLLSCTALLLGASGCASIFGESTQVINLDSKPQGAKVYIYNKRGKKVFAGTTPTVVSLRKKDKFFEGEDYVVSFKLRHHQSHTVYLNRSYSGWYLSNILNIVGLLFIDPMTGAMWNYSPDRLKPRLEIDKSDLIDEEVVKAD